MNEKKVTQIFQLKVLLLNWCQTRQFSTFHKSHNAKQSNGNRRLETWKDKIIFCKCFFKIRLTLTFLRKDFTRLLSPKIPSFITHLKAHFVQFKNSTTIENCLIIYFTHKNFGDPLNSNIKPYLLEYLMKTLALLLKDFESTNAFCKRRFPYHGKYPIWKSQRINLVSVTKIQWIELKSRS